MSIVSSLRICPEPYLSVGMVLDPSRNDLFSFGVAAYGGERNRALTVKAFHLKGRRIKNAGFAALIHNPDQLAELADYLNLPEVTERGVISDMHVHPRFRGRGLSRHLLSYLIRECVDREVLHVTAFTALGYERVHSLYEKLGYQSLSVPENKPPHWVEVNDLTHWIYKDYATADLS